jgi:hypothetical protein
MQGHVKSMSSDIAFAVVGVIALAIAETYLEMKKPKGNLT